MGGRNAGLPCLWCLLWAASLALAAAAPGSDAAGMRSREGVAAKRQFVVQASGPTLGSVTVPTTTSVASTASGSLSISVTASSSDQPSGLLNITDPTGNVGYQASLTFAAAGSGSWSSTTTVPLNFYMPEGMYSVSGVSLSNSAGTTTAAPNAAFNVNTVYSASSYPALTLCSTGNVGFASFLPKPGLPAAGVSCCSTTLTCALSGAVNQTLSVGALQLSGPALALTALTVNVTQLLNFSGTGAVALSSQADLLAASGATAGPATSPTLTMDGCVTGNTFALGEGVPMAPAGDVTMNVPFTNAGNYTVAGGRSLTLACTFEQADPAAQVWVGQGSSLAITGVASCSAGSIAGAGSVVVSGSFVSLGCSVGANRLAMTGALAVLCGTWPTTTLTGSAMLSIASCAVPSCPCSVVQLLRRAAVVVGNLSTSTGSTLKFDMSSGNLRDYGCLDVTGYLLVQGSVTVLLGAAVGDPTVTKTLTLVRSGLSSCDSALLSRITWTNGPSNYSIAATCSQMAGPLPTVYALSLTWNGTVTVYGRGSLDTSLAWALVAIALLLLFSLCAVVTVKICRRPALPSHSGLFDEQDGQVASVLQEADPFIPPLTQPVKGPSPRTAAASASA